MSKPLFIQADPKIRVHGDYDTGAAHINRARSALYIHLLEDSAYNIQVSKKKYILSPGVECISTHEYGQTYLDIYSSKVTEIYKLSSSKEPAYFGTYLTDIVSSYDSSMMQVQFASYNADFTVNSYSNPIPVGYSQSLLGEFDQVGTQYWDYLGNNLVGLVNNLVDANGVELQIYLYIINARNTNTIEKQYITSGFCWSMLYFGGTQIILNVSTGTSGSGSIYAYIYDFVSKTIVSSILLGSYSLAFGVGLSVPRMWGGGVASDGYRIIGQAGTTQTGFELIILHGSSDSNAISYLPADPAINSAVHAMGFTILGEPVVVFYNSTQSGYSSLPVYLRIYWNGNKYDFNPIEGTTYNTPIGAWSIGALTGEAIVKVVPFANGVLVITTQFIIYFASGEIVSYIFTGWQTQTQGGKVYVGYGAETVMAFNNTESLGLFNLYTGVRAVIGSPNLITPPPTWPQSLQYVNGIRWVPLKPKEWLDYPGLYT